MRRFLKIGGSLLVLLIVLLGVNAFILDKETKPAEVNAPNGEIAELSTVDLQYVDSPATGSGPEGQPIVLLHCYTCSLRWWDQVLPAPNENHRVITFDLLGHGGSEKPTSGYEIESQSAAVGEALNQLGVTNAAIVGHSLGGMVATSLAEQSSDIVDKVVLADVPADSGDGDLPFTADLGTWPIIGEAMWRVKIAPPIKSASSRSFAPGTDVSEVFPDEPDRVVDDVRAMTYKAFEESKKAADDFLNHGGIPSRLTNTGVPVLVLMGTEDQILDADDVLGKFEAIPGARLVPVDGVGHSPNVEAPEETADEILSFVGNAPIEVPPPNPPDPPGGNGGKGGKGGGRDSKGGQDDNGSQNDEGGNEGGKKDDKGGEKK